VSDQDAGGVGERRRAVPPTAVLVPTDRDDVHQDGHAARRDQAADVREDAVVVAQVVDRVDG